MTEREKMVEIMKKAEEKKCISSASCNKCQYKNNEFCARWLYADALIAKGYGKIDRTVEEKYSFTLELIDKIKDAEHRAEVAERAFDNTMKVFHEILSAIFPDKEIDLDEWKKNNLVNAEKELAEEDKR